MTVENRALRWVTFETTLRCDQRCAFCGSGAGKPAADELSTDEATRLIDAVARQGALGLELSGGETYLREDWLEIIRHTRQAGLDCAMITAGRGMNVEKARAAKDAGLQRAAVSLDGLEATHDTLRGVHGSFARGLSAIEAFREAEIPVGCNTQLNAKNYRELPALGDLLVTLGLYAWQVQIMIPMGRALEDETLLLQPYELLELIPLVASVAASCRARGLVTHAGDNIGYFGPHEHTLRKSISRAGHTSGCGAGHDHLAIDQVGNFKACSALDGPEHFVANARSADVASVWRDSEPLAAYAGPVELRGYCARCYYGAVCRGGCSATSVALTGVRGNNPYCHHRALELAREGMRERLVPLGTHRGGLRTFGDFELRLEPLEQHPLPVGQPPP